MTTPGGVTEETGGCEKAVRVRVKTAWQKWRDLSAVLCNARLTVKLKVKIFSTVVGPVLLYGAETWPLKKSKERLLCRTEMRMLRWAQGVSLQAGVESIEEN